MKELEELNLSKAWITSAKLSLVKDERRRKICPGLHVGVLYASPLGYYEDGSFKVLAPLSYVNEIESIEATLQPGNNCVANLDLRFSHNVGTPSNFMKIAEQNPRVLHFICHGVVSKSRKCSLALQSLDGLGAFISTKSLNKMLEIS